ncbi:hypothetical protein PYW08_005467 [Mythimna loreyi]|uniref:Uncharacterized protein n=1 Tax=Mythimna loreyi TaxID=667449 RepID=A0ACC2QLR2_9NEOP|nr:hypothetical protein PYW08_005467 [Mythimna loreyi]
MCLSLAFTAVAISFIVSEQSETKRRIASLVVLPPLVLGYDELYHDSKEAPKNHAPKTRKAEVPLEEEMVIQPRAQEIVKPVKQPQSQWEPVTTYLETKSPTVAPVTKNETKEAPASKKKPPAKLDPADPKKQSASPPAPKKQPAAGPISKKQQSAAPVKKKQPAAAHILKKQPAVAPIPKKHPAVDPISKKHRRTAPVKKKHPVAVPILKKQPAVASVPKKQLAADPMSKTYRRAALVPKKQSAAASILKKQQVVAPVPKKQSVVASVPKKQPAAFRISNKQRPEAPDPKKKPAAVPTPDKQTDEALLPKKQSPAVRISKKQRPAAQFLKKIPSAAPVSKKQPIVIKIKQPAVDGIKSQKIKKIPENNAEPSIIIDTKGRRNFRRNYRSIFKKRKKLNHRDSEFLGDIDAFNMDREWNTELDQISGGATWSNAHGGIITWRQNEGGGW